MRVRVITPPAPVVTWEDADAHLKLGGDEAEKPYVEGLIAAATAHIDGPDGWLGRAIGVQTLEARFGGLEHGSEIRLPYPELIELVSAKYLDAANVEQNAAIEAFYTHGASLASVDGLWPWTGHSLRHEAIRVRYKAGYQNDIPAPVRVAILMMVGDMHRNRTSTQPGNQSVVPMSTKIEDLLGPFRVYA